jgi:hypothetical protein
MGEGIKIDTEGEYGLRGEEVKAGYERLHPTEPEPAPLAEDDSLDDMKAVAEQLAERWRSEGRSPTGEQPLIDRGYVDVATGERTAPNKVVSEKEFARDLAKVHQDEAEAAQQQHDAELANQIDNARIEFNLNNNPELRAQLEAAQQQQTQPQQPAQQPAQQSGIHPDVEAALQNQHVRQAIEAELAQVEQARQQYAAVTMQNVILNFVDLHPISSTPHCMSFSSAIRRDMRRLRPISTRSRKSIRPRSRHRHRPHRFSVPVSMTMQSSKISCSMTPPRRNTARKR